MHKSKRYESISFTLCIIHYHGYLQVDNIVVFILLLTRLRKDNNPNNLNTSSSMQNGQVFFFCFRG